MLSYKLYLESLNTPYPFHWDRYTSSYVFTNKDGAEYYVNFDGSSKNVEKFLKDDKDSYELSFHDEHESMDITGAKDQFKVFATVINIIKKFMKETKVKQLLIASEKNEQSRTSLYNKLINKFTDWKVSRDSKGGYELFILSNPNYKG